MGVRGGIGLIGEGAGEMEMGVCQDFLCWSGIVMGYWARILLHGLYILGQKKVGLTIAS